MVSQRGFLKTPKELIEDEKKENTKPKIQLPEHLQVRPVTPVEKYIKVTPSPQYLRLPRALLAGDQQFQGWNLNMVFKSKAAKAPFLRI
ncbi:unnamed protein product [Bubo scandiacus]